MWYIFFLHISIPPINLKARKSRPPVLPVLWNCSLHGPIAFPPIGGLTNHVHFVTGGRLKAASFVVAFRTLLFDCPWICLRCILCGLPDLHLLYNGGFSSGTPFFATCISPALLGDLYLFHSVFTLRLLSFLALQVILVKDCRSRPHSFYRFIIYFAVWKSWTIFFAKLIKLSL